MPKNKNAKKTEKKIVNLQDLKPKRDAKGGFKPISKGVAQVGLGVAGG